VKAILSRFNPNGKVNVFMQNTGNESAKQTFFRRFRKPDLIQWLPASPFSFDENTHDCIVAALPENHLVRQLLGKHRLGAELDAGAYLIQQLMDDGKSTVLITGGDLAGLLYGISDLAANLRKTESGLEYTGDAKLEKPAFQLRGFWNWDIRTRWNTDCEFPVSYCCQLDYPHDAAVYIDNMKRVIDGMIDYRRNVLTIWGFLRDEHGGIEAAQEVCRYANDHGIDLCPGIGTHFYGGPFYRGDHPFNLDTHIRTHPDNAKVGSFGYLRPCPTDPKNISWLKNGIHWLFETFEIKGVNLENGDYFLCECPRCQSEIRKLKSENPQFIQSQYLSYKPVLEELVDIPQSKWNVYATYTGFSPHVGKTLDPLDWQYDEEEKKRQDVLMARNPHIKNKALKHRPAFADLYPDQTIAQWNVDGQLRQSIPLTGFLDDGDPHIVYDGPLWTKEMKAPCDRNVFYSTSSLEGSLCLSSIKELAIRVAQGGFDGAIYYGERSPREVPVEINYLAQSHFSYHPLDSLREFASAQLSHRVGGEELAQEFIEILCRKDAGQLTDEDRATSRRHEGEFRGAMTHTNATPDHTSNYSVERFDSWCPYSYWRWLGG
jgi:hypothetical protein